MVRGGRGLGWQGGAEAKGGKGGVWHKKAILPRDLRGWMALGLCMGALLINRSVRGSLLCLLCLLGLVRLGIRSGMRLWR